MAQSFPDTQGSENATVLPQAINFTLDAAVAGEVELVNVPDDCYKISVYFDGAEGLVSMDSALSDGVSTITRTTAKVLVVPADGWFDLDMGHGTDRKSRINSVFVASATTSTRVYVLAMGASEHE